MKKRVSLLCGCLAVLICLSSCGVIVPPRKLVDDDGTDSGTAFTEEPYETIPSIDDKPELDRLVDMEPCDYNGVALFVAIAEEAGKIFSDEGTCYSEGVYYRNQAISEKYNCRIVNQSESTESLYANLRSAAKTKLYYADLAVVPFSDLGMLCAAGYILNMNAVSHIDYEAEYYHQNANRQLSLGNRRYGIVGNATDDLGACGCLFINLDLCDQYGIELDYQDISSGGFTYDAFLTMLKKAPDGGALVSSFDKGELCRSAFYSAGVPLISNMTSDNKPDFIQQNDGVDHVMQSMADIMKMYTASKTVRVSSVETSADGAESTGTKDEELGGLDLFAAGEALFMWGVVDDLHRLASCKYRIELLPQPKIDREQDGYYTYVGKNAPVLTVLADTNDIDTIGYLINAINAASGDYLHYLYLKDAQVKAVRGIHTLDMIDLATENPVYDIVSGHLSSSASFKKSIDDIFTSVTEKGSTFSDAVGRNRKSLNSWLKGI